MLTLTMLSNRLNAPPDEVLVAADRAGARGRMLGSQRLWDRDEFARIAEAIERPPSFLDQLIEASGRIRDRAADHRDIVTGERWILVWIDDWLRLAGLIPVGLAVRVVRNDATTFAVMVPNG
jgi:hypothetical protein